MDEEWGQTLRYWIVASAITLIILGEGLGGIQEKMKNKKGISALVVTILLILITVSAVGIIWGAIMPIIYKINSVGYMENYTAMILCFNDTARAYCNSINLSLFDIEAPTNIITESFRCKSERTGISDTYYFLKSEIEVCKGKNEN
jgi:flagellin-like protein